MPPADAAARWTQRLADLAPRAGVVGAVLGIWHDGQETLAAHGVLSTATDVPVTTGSLFQIGSITKAWTATMIMQLAAEGRLALDSTVAELLPGVRLGGEDVSAAVTVRHLLTHSSGLDGDIFTDTGRGGDCLERYVSGLAGAALTCPPGQAYSYCNSGYVLLGRIIELLDGREWDESLRERLTGPMGLSQTVTLPEQALLHRAAVGHLGRPREREPVGTWTLPRSLGPAGLITASAHDLLAFARMHLDGGKAPNGARVLGTAAAEAMRERQVRIPGAGEGPRAVGLAWRLHEWTGGPLFGHDGSTAGQNAYLRIDPASGLIACLLTNASSAEPLYRPLFAEIFEQYAGLGMPADPSPAPDAGGRTGPELASFAGRYERSSRRFDIAVRDGRLRATLTVTGLLSVVRQSEPEVFELLPADGQEATFVTRSREDEPWAPVTFARLADGSPYLYASGRITPKVSAA